MNPKNPSVSLYENRERLVNKALAGDKELLKRLAYLPYISQWVKDRLVPQEVLIRYQKEIHPDFTQELVLMWEEYDFSYEQTKEWIDIGLTPNDACFCYWLLDIKKVDLQWCSNHEAELPKLAKEFIKWMKLANSQVLSDISEEDESETSSEESNEEAEIKKDDKKE